MGLSFKKRLLESLFEIESLHTEIGISSREILDIVLCTPGFQFEAARKSLFEIDPRKDYPSACQLGQILEKFNHCLINGKVFHGVKIPFKRNRWKFSEIPNEKYLYKCKLFDD